MQVFLKDEKLYGKIKHLPMALYQPLDSFSMKVELVSESHEMSTIFGGCILKKGECLTFSFINVKTKRIEGHVFTKITNVFDFKYKEDDTSIHLTIGDKHEIYTNWKDAIFKEIAKNSGFEMFIDFAKYYGIYGRDFHGQLVYFKRIGNEDFKS